MPRANLPEETPVGQILVRLGHLLNEFLGDGCFIKGEGSSSFTAFPHKDFRFSMGVIVTPCKHLQCSKSFIAKLQACPYTVQAYWLIEIKADFYLLFVNNL